MRASYSPLPSYVLDQILGAGGQTIAAGNLDYSKEAFERRHTTAGEHDDPYVARCAGAVYYEGSYASGVWSVQEGVNFTVSDIDTGSIDRCRVTFSGTWSSGMLDALYAPVLANVAKTATASAVQRVPRWFNRTTMYFDVSFTDNNGGASTFAEISDNTCAFTLFVHGLRP